MKKWTTALVLCGAIAICSPLATPLTVYSSPCTNISVSSLKEGEAGISSTEVFISNSNLEARLKSLLGLGSEDKLKTDSFINSSTYSNTDTTTIKTSLDLSNLELSNISELCQFVWPETLASINLAGNNFGNDELTSVLNFCSYSSGQSITIGSGETAKTIFVASNLKDIIKNINLSFNSIDLNQLSPATLENEKYIWGVQGFDNLSASGLATSSELSLAQYYFRASDFNFVTGNLLVDGTVYSTFNEKLNQVVNIASEYGNGKITINLSGQPKTATGYYTSWSKSIEYTAFSLELLDSVVIERNQKIFELNSGIINISPSSLGYQIIGNPTTRSVGTHTFNIRVYDSNGQTRVLQFPYTVVDTTSPTLSLVGANTIYWSKNKAFDFDKYTATANDSGDSINYLLSYQTDKSESELNADDYTTPNAIIRVTNLDITKLSGDTTPYYIKYFCTDSSGNSATPITRYIYIQEQALDTIVLRSNTKDLILDDEITLEVKPDSNIEMSNYQGFTFEYKWYVDGKLEYTTKGDSINAKSTQTFIFDSTGLKEVKVVLVAKNDTNTIEIQSEILYLDIVPKIDNTQIIIISCSIAILLIILFFSIRVIIKTRRAKKGIAKKAKTSSYTPQPKAPQQSKPSITIVQGSNPNNNGGNINTRPPENSNDNSLWGG